MFGRFFRFGQRKTKVKYLTKDEIIAELKSLSEQLESEKRRKSQKNEDQKSSEF